MLGVDVQGEAQAEKIERIYARMERDKALLAQAHLELEELGAKYLHKEADLSAAQVG